MLRRSGGALTRSPRPRRGGCQCWCLCFSVLTAASFVQSSTALDTVPPISAATPPGPGHRTPGHCSGSGARASRLQSRRLHYFRPARRPQPSALLRLRLPHAAAPLTAFSSGHCCRVSCEGSGDGAPISAGRHPRLRWRAHLLYASEFDLLADLWQVLLLTRLSLALDRSRQPTPEWGGGLRRCRLGTSSAPSGHLARKFTRRSPTHLA